MLEDERRVLSGREMQITLKMVDEYEDPSRSSGGALSRFLTQESLKPFIYKEKEVVHFRPIYCYKDNTKIIYTPVSSKLKYVLF